MGMEVEVWVLLILQTVCRFKPKTHHHRVIVRRKEEGLLNDRVPRCALSGF